jgi:hypothetical protein
MIAKNKWIVGLAGAAVAAGGIAALSVQSARAADSEVPWQTDPGGGAPEKTLLENDALRVTLISFPAGFHRDGGERRPYDTLIAYVDEGDFKIVPRAGAPKGAPRAKSNPAAANSASRLGKPAQCDSDATKNCGPVGPDGNNEGQPLAVGTITYHPKGNVTPTLNVGHPYRALYIEIKEPGASMKSTGQSVSAAQAKLPWGTDPGGGAPEKVLLDNGALRVTLISFPMGFHRAGDERRPYNTLIAYLDEGNFKTGPRAGVRPPSGDTREAPGARGAAPNASRLGKPAHCDPSPNENCGAISPDGNYTGQPYAPGTINYHPKGNVTPDITVTKTYRALYLEFK